MNCILLNCGLFEFICTGPDGGGGGIFFNDYNSYNTLDELYSLYWVFFAFFFVKALTAAAFFLLSIISITP
jgi:hypothetical protein